MSLDFKDRHGRTWNLKLTLDKALRVNRSDFSLYLPADKPKVILTNFDKETVQLLLTDAGLMFAVIEVIVHEQLEKPFGAGKSEEEYQVAFAEGIDGDCVEPARDAFVEALGDFFPAAKTVLSTFRTKIREYEAKTTSRLMELMPMVDQKVDQLLDNEVEKLKEKLSATSSL